MTLLDTAFVDTILTQLEISDPVTDFLDNLLKLYYM